MKSKVLVTGAAGFVGSHLVPALTKHDYVVTAVVKDPNEKEKISTIGVNVIVADLSRKEQLERKIPPQDIVIHLAAQISAKSKDQFVKNNVIATQNLIDISRSLKVKKFILFSSAAVTSKRLDWYAETKQEKEKIVKESKLNYIIVRPSMIYGPGDNKNLGWLAQFIKKMPIIPIPGNGLYGRQPLYVEDITKITIKLIETKNAKKIYEIHGKDYVPLKKIIEILEQELNVKKPVINIPAWLALPLAYLQEKILPNPKFTSDQIISLMSGEKFKGDKWWNLFNIRPTPIEEGIHKMLKNR